jgi:hypothetical protein
MSETTPAVPDDKSVVIDAAGRVIKLRDMDPADTLDLIEAAGSAAGNQAWFRMACMVCAVESIDGVPLPAATKKDHIRNSARKLGNEGLYAITKHMFPEAVKQAEGETPEDLVVAKN